jgi:hypothetical protein
MKMTDNRLSIQNEQNRYIDVYKSLKQRPVELLTPEELSEAIRQDIRCVGLLPEGMEVEGMPKLSKQEIEDIRFVSDSVFMDQKLAELPEERRTEAVSMAAILSDSLNSWKVPKMMQSDDFIWDLLRMDADLIAAVDKERRTPEMYMAALEKSGMTLVHFPEEMITSEIAMKAVQNNGRALYFVPKEMITPDICRVALNNLPEGYEVHQIIGVVPFSEVCMEQLKKYDVEKAEPFGTFMLFGSMNERVMTQEIANLAVRLDSECFKMVPERLMTPEMCMEAIKKDWYDMRFVPEHMKTKDLCEIAMSRCIHAQQLMPNKMITPEMYLSAVKVGGMALEYVPKQYRTPEICLQAVLSNPEAKQFVPKRFSGDYNIYEFYQGKLKNDFLLARQLSFEQVQKAFQGETVHVSGIQFAKNVTLRDFTLDYDRKAHQISMKALDDKPEKKQYVKNENKPVKRRGLKL